MLTEIQKLHPIHQTVLKNIKKDSNESQFFTKLFLNYAENEKNFFDLYNEAQTIDVLKKLYQFISNRVIGRHKIQIFTQEKQNITVIQIVNDDMPFLVDSLAQLISEEDYSIRYFIHPIIRIKRDKDGNLITFPEMNDEHGGIAESIIHVEIDGIIAENIIQELQAKIDNTLYDIRKATSDWQVIIRKIDTMITDYTSSPVPVDHDSLQETIAFLRWLTADHFTFLGYRKYKLDKKGNLIQDEDCNLGLLRDKNYGVLKHQGQYVDLLPEVKSLMDKADLITFVKASRMSSVHRHSNFDQIFMTYYENQKPVGLHCFIGLFTSSAYNERPFTIPVLRHKINSVVKRAGFRPSGHDAKALTHILESFPRDELFQIDEKNLYQFATGVLQLEIKPGIRLFARRDIFNKLISAFVYIPRDYLNTELREQICSLIAQAYKGECSRFSIQFGERNYVRIHYLISTDPENITDVNLKEIEEKISVLVRSWQDSLKVNLLKAYDTKEALNLHKAYAKAFPTSYREVNTPEIALADICNIEKLTKKNPILLQVLANPENDKLFKFKLFHRDTALILSDCLPVLENMGFRVLTENPYQITRPDGSYVWLHEFTTQAKADVEIDNELVTPLLEEAFMDVWLKQCENDKYNQLVLRCGANSRDVVILRALGRYLGQTKMPYSQALVEITLDKHAQITKQLILLFHCKFNPDFPLDEMTRKIQVENVTTSIYNALEKVNILDEDIILRRYLNVIESILRTNTYQKDDNGQIKNYVSFKINSKNITDLPLPRPMREIWVYAPHVEAVHLRFGMVARGGLRWSDRSEDFRTEVLGLVKAQQVKNAVIVPVGAKGGFFAKQLPDPKIDRKAWLDEGIRSYKTFISGLLDITDNLAGNEVIKPQNVICYDGDDPYLVVAADKGTATFSDIANGLSADYNFWLGDAFASGGSQGYDHKKMGITAKGAWESVKRHFREIGKNIQEQEFDVIGVGDMSGDVFGNGMMLSKKIRLIAAFDHRDIFIDPNPIDVEKSFEERVRLYNLDRSSWQDYNKKLISKGGGIFSRSEKSIPLTSEIKKLLGLNVDSLSPTALMKAILKAKTDLLWFGGIGTYIKAAEESHTDVGDKANDLIRVNADELNTKVIGEGANLGMTQKARIAFASLGGRLNTDAVDNSAGVDCSDHEVNIKIALAGALHNKKLTMEERNILLASMTDDVAKHVLQTNYNQGLALSVTLPLASKRIGLHDRFMRYLEKKELLNREVEFLPDRKEIARRKQSNLGLTRPELAVLMAYSKIDLFQDLLDGTLLDDIAFATLIKTYMPQAIVDKYSEELQNHRLRHEITALILTNAAINEGGISFVYRLCDRLHVTPEKVIKAYWIIRNICNLNEFMQQVHALDNKVSADIQTKLYRILRDVVYAQTRWFLLNHNSDMSIVDAIAFYKQNAEDLFETLPQTLSIQKQHKLAEKTQYFVEHGVDAKLAEQILALSFMYHAGDVLDIANSSKVQPKHVATCYNLIADRLQLSLLRDQTVELEVSDQYERIALDSVVADLDRIMRQVTQQAIEAGKTDSYKNWEAKNASLINYAEEIIKDVLESESLGLAKLSIVTSALRRKL